MCVLKWKMSAISFAYSISCHMLQHKTITAAVAVAIYLEARWQFANNLMTTAFYQSISFYTWHILLLLSLLFCCRCCRCVCSVCFHLLLFSHVLAAASANGIALCYASICNTLFIYLPARATATNANDMTENKLRIRMCLHFTFFCVFFHNFNYTFDVDLASIIYIVLTQHFQ